MKPIRIHRAVENVLLTWPLEVRTELAELLSFLASGRAIGVPASSPLPDVDAGAHELLIKDGVDEYEIYYFTKNAEALLVFHALKRKTRRRPSVKKVRSRGGRLGDVA